jgi:uncharacterized protein YjaG (DUF416 family)
MTQLLRTVVLLEGITHLEDLSLKEFIRTIESLKNKIITEKLDGANLWFGLDEEGVYTSREGKNPKRGRFRKVDDYAMVASYNAFRAAHLAIEKVASIIKKYLRVGDQVEMEVMFGRQPNTVTYGANDANFIVILRGVNGTPEERVNALSDALNGKTVQVNSTIVSSPDGETLELKDAQLTWKFTQVKPVDSKKINTKEVDKLLRELKKFLGQKNKVIPHMTNEEVAELALTSIPKEQREAAKKERERVLAVILNDYKLPIKEYLLNNFVRKIKPFLQTDELHPSEDIGVEGIVVRDPVSGSQTKIVDKDVFTAINTFNSAVRANIAGLVRTTDQDAPIEMRGGAFGQAKIRIAELLGARELAMGAGAKKLISKLRGSDALSTAKNVADSLNIKSLPSIRTKIASILKNTIEEVNTILNQFKQESGEFKLKLKTGKEIGISPEVMKRTLTAFAETKIEIAKVRAAVLASRTPADLILALYGRTIDALINGGEVEVKESFTLLRSIAEDGDGATTSSGSIGGGAEAQSMDTKAYGEQLPTTAGNISSYPIKLLGNKRMITRRPRRFVKPKKFPMPSTKAAMRVPEDRFSLIKSINEDWAHAGDMKFATDVDDAAAAKNDVEFKQLRNNVAIGGDNVTQMDVSNYLNKAHEINDYVDTVTFGMETDEGDIIKVYINAQQADNFEAALAQLLGKQDDVEAVINVLADKFDIVDVEWPESYHHNAVAQDQANADIKASTDASDDKVPTDNVPADDGEMDLSIDDETSDDETTNDEMDLSISDEEEESAPSDEEEESAPSDEEQSDEETDEETDEDNGEDEEESTGETDEFDQPVKRKKRNKTEESMKSFGQQFKDKLLAEARVPKKSKDKAEDQEDIAVLDARKKFEKQMGDLLEIFPTKQDKAIVTLMITLGAPIRALTLHKTELRRSIDPAAEHYIKNSSFRMWVKKLLNAISSNTAMSEGVVAEAEDFDKRLTSKYQHVIYHILRAIGMPESVEKTAARQLLSGIRGVAKMANEDSNVRIYLMSIADELGVSDKVSDMAEPAGVKEAVLTEDAAAASEALIELLKTLGIDVMANRTVIAQMARPNTKSRLMKLGAAPSLVAKLNTLTRMIGDKVMPKTTGGTTVPLSSGFTKSGSVIAEGSDAWVIATMGKEGGFMMKRDDMSIELKADEFDKLAYGLKHHKTVSVVSKGDKRFVFTKAKGGYNVKEVGDGVKHPDGLSISSDEIAQIIDMNDD